MKLFFRNSKWILFGLVLFFMGFLTINYINIRTPQTRDLVDEKLEHLDDSNKLVDENGKQNKELIKLIQTNKITESIRENEVKKTSKVQRKSENSSINKKQKRFVAYDGGGFGSVNSGVTKCADGAEIEVIGSGNRIAETDILYFHMGLPHNYMTLPNTDAKRHYSMVFAMESEPHSYGGETWTQADFRMWYNLDDSFPEPATYFENKMHLADLLSPPRVDYVKKEKSAHIVWVVSNCNAYNGREKYMRVLMDKLQVDSYGGCLKNKFSHPSEHMTGNIELFSKYKFVIAIENSNCQDYVTEKLVHAVASGSIPIVAGKDNKPDYLRFMPKNSYINIYDYKTVDDLVLKIKSIAENQTEYEKYIKFKKVHNFTREQLYKKSLSELIDLAKTVFDPSEEFFTHLIAKEKSEDKLCKLARYLNSKSKEEIDSEIKSRKMNRPDSNKACLPTKNLASDLIS